MILKVEKFENNCVYYSVKDSKNLPVEIYLIDSTTNTVITKRKYAYLNENYIYYISPHNSLCKFLDKVTLRSVHSDGEINLEINFNNRVEPLLINKKIFKSFFNDRESFYTLKEIFYDKCYKSEIVKPEPNDVVVDIGANLGFFSLFAYETGVKKIYCFEPDPKNFITLLENTKNLENVFCNNIAISNKVGISSFCFSEIFNAGSHLEKFSGIISQDKTIQTTNVVTINLEKIFELYKLEFIDFLKIDCEGAEIDIFENIKKEHLNKIRKVSLEFHSNDIKEKILSILKENNFVIEKNYYLHNSDQIGMILAYKN